jgi:hypothetical protein
MPGGIRGRRAIDRRTGRTAGVADPTARIRAATVAGPTRSTDAIAHIAAHAAASTKLVFFPPALDLSRLRGITLGVDDKPETISGDLVGSRAADTTAVAEATTQPAH